MEMKELYYFIAIAEEKSISKAAERLFMAQSSLSQFLGILENNVGSKLFIRTSRGVCLTQEGELMLQYAYKTLAEYRSVQNEIKDIKQLKSGRVIMGISTFRGSYLLPPVLNAFHLEHPDVKVEIVEKNSMALEQMLLSGEIDIALLVMSEADPRLNIERVMKDEICLLTSPTHPIMAFVRDNEDNSDSRIPQYVNLKDTLAYEYLLSDYDTILGREARRIFNRNGVQPIASNHALSALMSAAMGAAGLGLAFTYYSSRHYFRNAEFLSLGAESAFVDLGIALAAWQIPFQSSFSAKRYPDGGFAGGRWVSIRMLPSSYFSSRLQIASRCWYFSLVAIPPRIWRSDLFRSRTTRVWAARDGLIEISLSVQSLCTVLLLIPNRFAVWRTVAL